MASHFKTAALTLKPFPLAANEPILHLSESQQERLRSMEALLFVSSIIRNKKFLPVEGAKCLACGRPDAILAQVTKELVAGLSGRCVCCFDLESAAFQIKRRFGGPRYGGGTAFVRFAIAWLGNRGPLGGGGGVTLDSVQTCLRDFVP